MLEDSELTSQKYRQWKEHNKDLHLEIEKLAVQWANAKTKDTPPGSSSGEMVEVVAVETEAACFLSLGDGEMLVDAEPSLSSTMKAAGDSDVEPQSEQSVTAESSTDDLASPASRENYFYI